MAAQSRREDIRYFLYFLQTHAEHDLHQHILGNRQTMAHVTVMFLNINNHAGTLEAFSKVVASLELPTGTKRHHNNQLDHLGAIMDRWAAGGFYDMELDRFFPFSFCVRQLLGKAPRETSLLV
jgi:hypothetical protein